VRSCPSTSTGAFAALLEQRLENALPEPGLGHCKKRLDVELLLRKPDDARAGELLHVRLPAGVRGAVQRHDLRHRHAAIGDRHRLPRPDTIEQRAEGPLRAYLGRGVATVAFQVMRAQARWSMARWFSGFFDQRIRIAR